ncbi:hypothetical protein [Pelolinea submarina]|uniref:Uncharacterized protein n=1 Tax=Pelolinea submarina TaxID=913107 RepID=A0A347ZUT1_9CHLR|nr:hypothetical protein [Pelolinea submarina]REG10353.1 hypothetical protein DFR64_0208 [Pelolinea submarina]BBB49062.1 hypothetical protein Pelsub_P2293 [Pelolinea submarina]
MGSHKKKSGLPAEAYRETINKHWDEAVCMHPSASPSICDKIISAHTIQRSGLLERIISLDNHVLTFYKSEGLEPIRVGWRRASTIKGFCGIHDKSTFNPIEDHPFTGTPEQFFLIGYRALCHEIYQKRGALRASPEIIKQAKTDSGLTEEEREKRLHLIEVQDLGYQKGLEHFLQLKTKMDKQLLTKDYSGWNNWTVEFEGDISVVSTGAISPNVDLDGNVLQELHDSNSEQQSFLFGMIPTDKGGIIVFIWPKEWKVPEQFLRSLSQNSSEHLLEFIVQVFFAYIENTYFSESWWNSLILLVQNHLRNLAIIPNAYYTPIGLLKIKFMPWKLIRSEFKNNE